MTKEEYIGTLNLNGTKVDVGIDDYGQQYFFEFIDSQGNFQEIDCGAYNFCWLDDLLYMVDKEGFLQDKYNYNELYKQLGLRR